MSQAGMRDAARRFTGGVRSAASALPPGPRRRAEWPKGPDLVGDEGVPDREGAGDRGGSVANWGESVGDRGESVQDLVKDASMLPFDSWECHGWHLTPNTFHSPIPDTRLLPDELWTAESELPGIDMRDTEQLALLHTVRDRFGAELATLPRTWAEAEQGRRYFVDNGAFESVDGEIYYAVIREHRPARVVEIGAGWSTLLALQALNANRAEGAGGRLTAIEPYPCAQLRHTLDAEPDLAELRETPLQQVPLATFAALDRGDILFIDSSHVLRIGSDVQYEFLEILPRLRPGVLVHVHDIFLPGEYPRDWVLGPEHRFWNEQYLLQAYLTHNARVEVVWGSNWMHRRRPEELERAFASYDRARRNPGSFWFRVT